MCASCLKHKFWIQKEQEGMIQAFKKRPCFHPTYDSNKGLLLIIALLFSIQYHRSKLLNTIILKGRNSIVQEEQVLTDIFIIILLPQMQGLDQ